MRSLLRRWWPGSGSAGASAAQGALRAWADAKGWRFAAARGGDGFVIDAAELRFEWGPPQRDYIEGAELRVRADLGADADLQMLLGARALLKSLEDAVFAQATEDNRTRVDDRTPEEMRWLVLYPKVGRTVLGALADQFAAVASRRGAMQEWLDEPLRRALGDMPRDAAQVLIVQRGRFVLRRSLRAPTPEAFDAALLLARAAATSARRVVAEAARGRFDTAIPGQAAD
ncbi:MAG TPA: hypothetical protein VFQ20_14945 [Burkholderiaceae bacterium]|nr:hypothetical protein [Burkholderiaceae bacterium]